MEKEAFQSNDLVTRTVLIFFSVYFLLKIFLITSYLYSVSLLSEVIENPSAFLQDNFLNSLSFIENVYRYNAILFLICAVSFSIWIYRANKNLSSLRMEGLEFTPALSAWSFYVPLFFLYWPFNAVSEIWKASKPNDANIGENWKKFSTPSIISIWWILFIGTGVFRRVISGYLSMHLLSGIETFLVGMIVMDLLTLIATILIIYIVYKINENQKNKLKLLKPLASNDMDSSSL